jgi:uncharacterized membrane protein YcaP (DUF421 family)
VSSLLHAAAVYLLLLVMFRLAGKRTLAQITIFDLVLVLIIAEASQRALLGDDTSITQAAIVVATLISLDRALGWLSHRSQRIDRWANDVPLVLIEDGRLCRDRMDRMRIDDDDILESARELQGLERMDQIKYAVLERTGAISVIPRRP